MRHGAKKLIPAAKMTVQSNQVGVAARHAAFQRNSAILSFNSVITPPGPLQSYTMNQPTLGITRSGTSWLSTDPTTAQNLGLGGGYPPNQTLSPITPPVTWQQSINTGQPLTRRLTPGYLSLLPITNLESQNSGPKTPTLEEAQLTQKEPEKQPVLSQEEHLSTVLQEPEESKNDLEARLMQEIASYKEDLEKKDQEQKEYQAKIMEAGKIKLELTRDYENLESMQRENEKDIERLKGALEANNAQTISYQSALETANKNVAQQTRRIKKLEAELTAQEAALAGREKALAAERTELEAQKAAQEVALAEERAKNSSELAERAAELEERETVLTTASSAKTAELKKEREELTQTRVKIEEELKKNKQDLATQKKELETKTEALEEAKKTQEAALVGREKTLAEERAKNSSELAERAAALEAQEEVLTVQKAELTAERAKLTTEIASERAALEKKKAALERREEEFNNKNAEKARAVLESREEELKTQWKKDLEALEAVLATDQTARDRTSVPDSKNISSRLFHSSPSEEEKDDREKEEQLSDRPTHEIKPNNPANNRRRSSMGGSGSIGGIPSSSLPTNGNGTEGGNSGSDDRQIENAYLSALRDKSLKNGFFPITAWEGVDSHHQYRNLPDVFKQAQKNNIIREDFDHIKDEYHIQLNDFDEWQTHLESIQKNSTSSNGNYAIQIENDTTLHCNNQDKIQKVSTSWATNDHDAAKEAGRKAMRWYFATHNNPEEIRRLQQGGKIPITSDNKDFIDAAKAEGQRLLNEKFSDHNLEQDDVFTTTHTPPNRGQAPEPDRDQRSNSPRSRRR